jgi:hypothetical protein
VDLSHTRRVLEALRIVLPADHPCFRKAQVYLGRVQNLSTDDHQGDPVYLDGGFFTSIATPETNKSAAVPGIPDRWYSYATATCDGVLGLLAAGIEQDDPRVEQAMTWLILHPELSFPEGIPHDDPMQWHRVMKYYHLSVRGEINACIDRGRDQAAMIARILISEQRKNGSFINPLGASIKEDDPLLATALAIRALGSIKEDGIAVNQYAPF